MRILLYKRNGKDVGHDVHYTHEGNICRFGSDEEASIGMVQAMGNVTKIAGRISGLVMRVDKIGFNYKDAAMAISIEGTASTAEGTDIMKIVLPKVGWRESTREIENTYEKIEIPAGIEEADILAFKALMESLEKYVQQGAGQMDFNFEEETEWEKTQ